MITRSNLAHAVPLCTLLYFSCGCASHQMLAMKDREIRDLRQQNAGRQDAFVKALETVETLRAELGSAKYEKRELEQKVASSTATIRVQQESIDRLETQKAKLQEQLRQSELAYERLKHTYEDLKSVLSSMMTELSQTRSDSGSPRAVAQVDPSSEHTRLKRKIEQLRSQVIRERAARRTAELSRPPPSPAPSPPQGDDSPWVWRLTEQPPEVDTLEPGSLVVDEETKPDADDSSSGEADVLGTAFLWTLGAIPAIGVTLLMFIVLVRVMSRPPTRDTREAEEEILEATIADADVESESPHDEAPSSPEERADDLYEETELIAPGASRRGGDSDGRPAVEAGGHADAAKATTRIDGGQAESPQPSGKGPAETSFIDSLDWLDETRLPERPKYSQDTEAVKLPDSSADAGPEATRTEPEAVRTEPEAVRTEPEATRTEPEAARTEPEPASRRPPARSRPKPRVVRDGNSDTQMIERLDGTESGATQVLPNLYAESEDKGETEQVDRPHLRNQEFTDTAVLDVSGVVPEEKKRERDADRKDVPETVPNETQVLPPLLDFEDESELDEALAQTSDVDAEEEPLDEPGKTHGELLAELEDLMGEKFEETV